MQGKTMWSKISGSMRAEVIYHSMRTKGCRHESHPVV